MESTIAPLASGLELGPEFRVQSKLGQGGFGITYLVTALIDIDDRIQAGSLYVVKEFVLNGFVTRADDSDNLVPLGNSEEDRAKNWAFFTRLRDGFMQEARTMAKFHHKNIVEVFLVREANKTVYIIMEYVDGQPLSSKIAERVSARKYGLSWEELRPVAHQMLNALEYIHDREVIHRDIKPDNIMLRKNGDAVLIDFGGARTTERARGSMVLTPGYAPAEQWRAFASPQNETGPANEVGPATDLYSMAASFYCALTGYAPYVADEQKGTAEKRRPLTGHPLTANWRLPKSIAKAIDWALTFEDASQRPQNVQAWREAMLVESDEFAPGKAQTASDGDGSDNTSSQQGSTPNDGIGEISLSAEQATIFQESIERSRRSNALGLTLAGLASVVALVLLGLFFFTDVFVTDDSVPFGVSFTIDEDWTRLSSAIDAEGRPLPGEDAVSPKRDLSFFDALALAETSTFAISSDSAFGVRFEDGGEPRVVIVSDSDDFPMISAAQLADLELRSVAGRIEVQAINQDFAAWKNRN